MVVLQVNSGYPFLAVLFPPSFLQESSTAFSALTLLVGLQEEHLACKKL